MTGELSIWTGGRLVLNYASMRPRSNDRGIGRAARQGNPAHAASMRPRSNDRGIATELPQETSKAISFNEAPIK